MGWSNSFTNVTMLVCKSHKQVLHLHTSVVMCANVVHLHMSGIIDKKKFLCGQKDKFGFNCQAVSYCQGHIIDISIRYGGASTDCLNFETSKLCEDLKQGLMK
jgi:hypothetical protein